ncbi:MAG: NAD(P)H-dependent oxidoreductase [Saprospiraceae bacterium]|nr:NAD(P)H-dependent oxidoreductase [Saprospiraceae bacterium]
MKIVIISGSPREQSVSHRIARHLFERLSGSADLELAFIDMQTEWLQPIQQVWKNESLIPEDKLSVYTNMDQADGFIIVSPEYNGGYSSVMKNFLDHFPKKIFHRKAWGIVTGSTGAMGGMRASQQLQLLGAALSAIISPRMLITPHMDKKFDETGHLLDTDFERQIEGFQSEFLWLTSRLLDRT